MGNQVMKMGEKSHGIIGVIDVTKVMVDGGDAGVRSNKQQFKNVKLMISLKIGSVKWQMSTWRTLSTRFKTLAETSGSQIRPDHEWAQCNMCRQRRMLDPNFDSTILPIEWYS
ncbi:hypothetical protein Tco_0831638 [Tanacetum coccineum]